MRLERSRISELLSQGVTPADLLNGIEIAAEGDGLLGISETVKVHTSKEKKDLLHERTKMLLAGNRKKGKPLSGRTILQEIGGGPLKDGEWIQESNLPDGVLVSGTRGVHIIKKGNSI